MGTVAATRTWIFAFLCFGAGCGGSDTNFDPLGVGSGGAAGQGTPAGTGAFAGSGAAGGGQAAAGAGGRFGRGGFGRGSAGRSAAAGRGVGAAGRGAAGSVSGGAAGRGAAGRGAAGTPSTGAAGSPATGAAGTPSTGTGASFTQVYAIFTRSCAGTTCHVGASSAGDGLAMPDRATAHRNLVNANAVSCRGERRVVASNPDRSQLLHTLTHTTFGSCTPPQMPLALPMLAAADIEVIRSWIAGGAPNN